GRPRRRREWPPPTGRASRGGLRSWRPPRTVLLLVVHERRAHSHLRRVGGVDRAHAHRDPVRLVLEAVDRHAAVAGLDDLAGLVEDLHDELDLELLGTAVRDLELPP